MTVKELLQALREEQEWRFLGRGHLNELLHAGYREEFEIMGDRIRCKNPKAGLAPEPVVSPPPRLYCAVRPRAHPVVLERGLRPVRGQWLILARTKELAIKIGKRKDQKPVLLEVRAQEAAQRGVRFHCFLLDLFLVEELPADLLVGPPVAQEPRPRPTPKPPQEVPRALPGSFFPDLRGDTDHTQHRRKDKDPLWRRERRRRERG